jgi:hypothetical protein
VKGQRYGPEKLETEQVPERHQRAVVVAGIVSAKEGPDRGGENFLQVMEILKVGVIHNLSGIVVNEEVMESVKIRKGGKARQQGEQQDVSPRY